MGTYPKTCINNAACSVEQRQNAIYDYVGAVYSRSPAANYDGELRAEEKAAVIQKFGSLQSLSETDVRAYLEKARKDFLEPSRFNANQMGLCSRTEFFPYTKLRHPQLGKGQFLGFPHGNCGVEVGALYFAKGMELEVAAQPEKWVFFIEGHGPNTYMGRQLQQKDGEQILFQSIAEKLGIPIYNATPFNTTGYETLKAASQKYSTPVTDYLSMITFGLMILKIKQTRMPVVYWKEYVGSVQQDFAANYNINPEILREEFFKYINAGKVPENRSQEAEVWNKIAYDKQAIAAAGSREKELMGHLIERSNEINIAELKQKLASHPERKQAFYLAGPKHQNLVEAIYSRQ